MHAAAPARATTHGAAAKAGRHPWGMKRSPHHAVLATLLLAAACVQSDGEACVESSTARSGPTSQDVSPCDVVDAGGRRWIYKGEVELVSADVAALEQARVAADPPTALDLSQLDEQTLAEMLRPRRLVGNVEYELAEPDLALARRIKATDRPAPTPSSWEANGGANPRFVIDPDDRWQNTDEDLFPGSTYAYLGQSCTATLIGPSTALSAAHCFYGTGGWIATPSITFGASDVAPTQPFGSYLGDSVTIPGAWNGGGTLAEWEFDFAVLEFSPSNFPGRVTGWMGTEWLFSGTQVILGYPVDKPMPQQWGARGVYDESTGSRYEHSLDVVSGHSGACAYNESLRCTGIQSTQWKTPAFTWNEVRRWDTTTAEFFRAYGAWP
jgi:V8-like Glu-specific endopeptidase